MRELAILLLTHSNVLGGYGIAIINLTGEKKILKKATSKKDYLFLQIIGDKIYFSLTEVKSDEGWRDETKQAVSYWIMDKFGNNLVEIKRIKPLEEKIKKLLLIRDTLYEG